jgi:hypothetical protein
MTMTYLMIACQSLGALLTAAATLSALWAREARRRADAYRVLRVLLLTLSASASVVAW